MTTLGGEQAEAARPRAAAPVPPYRSYAVIVAGRLVTWTLAAAGANDVAQAGFSALTAKANQLQ